MSQQQMESDPNQSSDPTSYSAGYQETPYYNDDALSAVGHKLTWREEGDLPKDEFRLGLAIVTLLCFLILILAFVDLGFTSLASDKYLYIDTGLLCSSSFQLSH